MGPSEQDAPLSGRTLPMRRVVQLVRKSLKLLRAKQIFWLLQDTFRFLAFPLLRAESRGVFDSFEQAVSSAPRDKPVGYDHEVLANEYRESFRCDLDSSDYPVLFHLDRILRTIDRPSVVLDFGGNIGIHYIKYRKMIDLECVNWIVCDVSSIVRVGLEMCAREPGIEFIGDLGAMRGRPIDVFIGIGSVQYVDDLPALLCREVGLRPRHILIDQISLHDGKRFVTLQNGGPVYYPENVFNRAEFISNFEGAGYELVESWTDMCRGWSVPFHRRKAISASSGLHFVDRQRSSEAAVRGA